MSAYILILDDDADVATAAQLLLRRRHGQVATLNDPAGLPALLVRGVPDVVLLDLNFTPGRINGAEGLALLDLLRAQAQPPAVIAMTAYADVPLAVEALKRGANDFITKPWDNARLVAAVDQALARRAVARGGGAGSPELMGESQAMRELKALIASVAPTEANVMVLGENGVGKELVARAIHAASRRAAGTLLAVDMGALPESTFESELFGHRKGSFTDAKADRAGRFQAARGGSLFLDEIGNMPLAAQAKLLTALERREVTPIGADKPEAIDVRIISATNLDEARLFDPSVFRADLLFRLNTIVLRVPSLRERREDVPLLLRHYLTMYEAQYQRPVRNVAASALDTLVRHDWPGNVRALRHACERAVILGQGVEYAVADFGLATSPGVATTTSAAGISPVSALAAAATVSDTTLDAIERAAIASTLAQFNGNISHAAKTLGISRAALYRKLGKHGI
ncbi:MULTISPECIES: sigma-54 dependent transcriptional regulator [unclassified Duganella]|uniref:sigma-54-dependent transcriptional regulator n=1 Tax=unclassified Duganella TaxID=2636909 RepID=UPI0008921DF5|nr:MULTISPECIES: sigma-54 dependent transcriptional regulator [unclassified Duganella]SDG92190.1 DNA-binding transcriptional response regulator, NtrC family, contains REC, AAA-type ATPase, and a Fis-type DNA-binding domains [Duganella sp. OV458]SDJ50207.1 DNA-binding transcriptional response regulator, NtrC family, contains REC, AAA-type ATPase, and a Fis-type DNA-binding domains [Duganella sp. OV510]